MKSLRIIQALAKIARIICLIVFILCIIGAAGCLIGIIVVSSLRNVVLYEGKTLNDILIENRATFESVIAALIVGLLSTGVGIYLSKYNELFYKRELAVGTPFKMEVVKDIRKVSVVNIVVSFSLAVVATITVLIISGVTGVHVEVSYSLFGTIGYGLVLLLISLFAQYGAEIDEAK